MTKKVKSAVRSKTKNVKIRMLVNYIFISFSIIISYALSLLGKGNGVYYVGATVVILLIIGRVKFYPLTEHHLYPILFSLVTYFVLFLYFSKMNISFSTALFLIEGFFACAWLTSWAYVKNRFSSIIVGYFKTKNTDNLEDTHKYSFVEINVDKELDISIDAIVYDEIVTHNSHARLYIAEKGIRQIPVIELSTVLQRTSGKISMEHIALCKFTDFSISPVYELSKRVLDVSLTLIASPFILLLMIFTGIGVKLDSKGPAFFTQERTGRGDVPFKMYKFRSMSTDSEKDGAKFASSNDTRVTKFGKFIRKFRLDEVPQFINIIKGDMSLIGPRPEQKVFTDQFNIDIPFYPYRHAVRPGITGWAQVSQGYAATVEQTEQKVEYDLYYIKNFSVWLDILVVLKTIKTVFTGFGAR